MSATVIVKPYHELGEPPDCRYGTRGHGELITIYTMATVTLEAVDTSSTYDQYEEKRL